jgi:hypothetical protein
LRCFQPSVGEAALALLFRSFLSFFFEKRTKTKFFWTAKLLERRLEAATAALAVAAVKKSKIYEKLHPEGPPFGGGKGRGKEIKNLLIYSSFAFLKL